MIIRLGTIDDLDCLWGSKNSPTKAQFVEGITKGKQEFWVVKDEEAGISIGELHIIWDSEDKDEANGRDRAYLCAFRINKNYQGKGLGSKLMKRVLERVSDKGFSEVTIGVEENAERLKKMYNLWGFSTLIKTKHVDHHNVDMGGNPKPVDVPFELYLYRLP